MNKIEIDMHGMRAVIAEDAMSVDGPPTDADCHEWWQYAEFIKAVAEELQVRENEGEETQDDTEKIV